MTGGAGHSLAHFVLFIRCGITQDASVRKYFTLTDVFAGEDKRALTSVIQLISSQQHAQLLENGARSARNEEHDPFPVVKLFVPDAAAVWLLAELDPDDTDLAYGVCDLGLGAPKLDYVRLSDLAALSGQPVRCDIAFVATQALSAYLREAQALGSIRA